MFVAEILLASALLTSVQSTGSMPSDFVPVFERLEATNKALCADYDGEMAVEDRAVKAAVDFNGDGIVDPIVADASFACSGSATLFSGGTGGSNHHVYVSNDRGGYDHFEFLGHAYRITLWEDLPVLTMSVHFSRCGIDRPSICMMSYTYHDGRFQAADDVVEPGYDISKEEGRQ